jgi:hypothetical protein
MAGLLWLVWADSGLPLDSYRGSALRKSARVWADGRGSGTAINHV